ncbi:MAG: hypothetical protein IKI94_08845 [Ruminococcus sp.]|nr:hypothetical protein [Ruminococcus sp.]MBR6646423.1 hypothetical protein [Clostridia bacterium]
MKQNRKDISLTHKIVINVSVLLSLSVIVLAIMQMFNIWENAINVFVPLCGVINLCQAYLHWNTSRKTAYFSIGTAVFIFICAILVFFIK